MNNKLTPQTFLCMKNEHKKYSLACWSLSQLIQEPMYSAPKKNILKTI